MQFHFTITVFILGSLCATCAFLSMFLSWQEIAEVNRKLPADQQISPCWMHVDKFWRIKREYKRLYPNGKLHLLSSMLEISAVVFFVLALMSVGFFSSH